MVDWLSPTERAVTDTPRGDRAGPTGTASPRTCGGGRRDSDGVRHPSAPGRRRGGRRGGAPPAGRGAPVGLPDRAGRRPARGRGRAELDHRRHPPCGGPQRGPRRAGGRRDGAAGRRPADRRGRGRLGAAAVGDGRPRRHRGHRSAGGPGHRAAAADRRSPDDLPGGHRRRAHRAGRAPTRVRGLRAHRPGRRPPRRGGRREQPARALPGLRRPLRPADGRRAEGRRRGPGRRYPRHDPGRGRRRPPGGRVRAVGEPADAAVPGVDGRPAGRVADRLPAGLGDRLADLHRRPRPARAAVRPRRRRPVGGLRRHPGGAEPGRRAGPRSHPRPAPSPPSRRWSRW